MNDVSSFSLAGARLLAASKACRIHRFGPPDVITLEDIAQPVPDKGEVLVRVKAAGVGPWDAWIRAGRSALPQPLPLTLGSDISGVVVAVGEDVLGFAPGNAVFGVTNARFTGGYADYAIASAATIAKKPLGFADIHAASVPVVAVTAWQALFEEARLVRGRTVLIHGGAGSVGAFAVQLARWSGLRVIATTSAKNVDYVRSLGADKVLDDQATRFEEGAGGVDAVIDLVGGDLQARSFAVLKPGGTLVSAVSEPDLPTALARGVNARFFLVSVTMERLTSLAAMIAAKMLATSVGAVLPLAAARVAHEMLEGSRSKPRGKIVLRVAD